jgi:hypothetical protein
MKMKNNLFYKCAFGIFSFILISCNDVDLLNISKDVQIQESLVLPIAEGTISIEDILNQFDLESQIVTDADTINFISEVNTEYQFKDVDLLKNAINKVMFFPLVSGPVQTNATIPLPISNELILDLGLEPNSTTNRFDSVKVSSVTFGIVVSPSDLKLLSNNNNISPSDLKIIFVFPKMHYINSSEPITKEVTVNQFGQINSFELTNFMGYFEGMTGVPFQVQFKSGNRELSVGNNGVIDMALNISQIAIDVAWGRFELTTTENTSLKMPLDMLSLLPEGLRFANPKALIKIESNIGSYIRFNIESIKAYSKDGSTVKQALFEGNTSTFQTIDVKPATPGLFVSKQLRTLDKNYGTTDQLFDSNVKLDTLEYKFSFQTDDELNNASSTTSFVIPGMKLKANIKIQIPFYLKEGSNISISDTINDINGDVFEHIDMAVLALKVTNSLPVKVTYSMKFFDELNNLIITSINDSSYVINSGLVDGAGLVTSPTVTPINIELAKEQAEPLKNAKSMIYTILVEGQDASKQIQFTKNNYIKVKLGVFAKGSITTTIGSNN